MTRTIDQLLDQARAQLRRLHPHQAAAVLQDLGLHRATDLIGGFRAWARAGLPTRTSRIAQ
jgi:hypothetical protein